MTVSTPRPVRPSDRVSDVLARDERLVEVFARQSPHFAKLRNPVMRRVMARLVTVEQAARMCGASAESLMRELNLALGAEPAGDAGDANAGDAGDDGATTGFALPPDTSVVELDVREDLRSGREPFSRIMTAVGALRDDEVLRLRATFEPVPLFAVMAKRGFHHHAAREGDDDWSVWFYREGRDSGAPVAAVLGTGATAVAPDAAATADPADAAVPGYVLLDVRGLEPPEPMRRTLEAAEQLSNDAVLVHVNVRVPRFLLPILEERGFEYDIDQSNPERVVVRIRRASPAAPTRDTRGG